MLHIPSGGSTTLEKPRVFFLDEFRVVVPALSLTNDPLELIVFNTLLPQGHPRNSRRFRLPSGRHGGHPAFVYVDPDRYLGTPDRDVPLITDPTQTILVVQVLRPVELKRALLVVQIQDLMKYVLSTHTDVCIPWDEWGRGAVTMEIPVHNPFSVNVHGIHVLLLHSEWQARTTYAIRSYDFSRHGCGALPFRDEGGRVGRSASFWNERGFTFQVAEENTSSQSGMKSLGDGTFLLVSHFTHSRSNGVIG